MVPDLDRPVWTAWDENLRVEGVPLYSIHCHAVGIISLQELAWVSLGALWQKRQSLDLDQSWWYKQDISKYLVFNTVFSDWAHLLPAGGTCYCNHCIGIGTMCFYHPIQQQVYCNYLHNSKLFHNSSQVPNISFGVINTSDSKNTKL